jgi:hypothetical protein
VRQATAAQRAQADAAAAAAAAQADELVVSAPLSGTVQLGEAAASDGVALPGGLPPSSQASRVSSAASPLLRVAGRCAWVRPSPRGRRCSPIFDLSTRYVVADVDEVDAPQRAHRAAGARPRRRVP